MSTEKHETLRKQLARHVEQYLQGGGEIHVYEQGETATEYGLTKHFLKGVMKSLRAGGKATHGARKAQ